MDNSQLYAQNVPMASVDQNFSIPGMGGMQPQQAQPPPELQHVTDVLTQYIQSKQNQQSGNGMLQQIFANRLQPEMQDVSRSINQTQQAYGAPDLFKAASPQEAMASRYANELSPYTSILEAQGKIGTNQMNQSGGATGVLVNRLMAADPSLSIEQALQKVQTGFRSNTTIDAQGNLVPMQGALGTLAGISNAKQTGQNISDLQYKPKIAGDEAQQKMNVELGNAANLEAQKKIGAGEITPIQQLGKGRNQATDMIQNIGAAYDKLDQMGGAVNPNSSAAANLGASMANSPLGQTFGKKFGTRAQSVRNQIEQARPLLINAIRQATGMSAKAMDSNAELQFYLKAATDPTLDITANKAALANLERLYGISAGGSQGGIPNPPTPGQIQQQMPVTHRYNPATGQVEQMQ